MRYITALTDPQIRKLLKREIIQLGLFEEKVYEVEVAVILYLLRKNQAEAHRLEHRVADKLDKLEQKVEAHNQQLLGSPRCQPEAGCVNSNSGSRVTSCCILSTSSVSTQKEDPSEMKPTPGRSHGLCEGGGGAGHFRISRISSP